MTKLLLSAIFICGVEGMQAQDQTIRVEYEDMGKVRMLAAQYDLQQRQQREEMYAKNYDVAIKNFSTFTSQLGQLEKFTTNPKILKEIEKAHKQNERLFEMYKRRNYNTEFYKLENTIKKIAISVDAYKEEE